MKKDLLGSEKLAADEALKIATIFSTTVLPNLKNGVQQFETEKREYLERHTSNYISKIIFYFSEEGKKFFLRVFKDNYVQIPEEPDKIEIGYFLQAIIASETGILRFENQNPYLVHITREELLKEFAVTEKSMDTFMRRFNEVLNIFEFNLLFHFEGDDCIFTLTQKLPLRSRITQGTGTGTADCVA